MQKEAILNKDNPLYRPNIEELGLTEVAHNLLAMNYPNELTKLENDWINKNINRINRKKERIEKKEKMLQVEYANHWYNSLDVTEIERLITNTVPKSKEILDKYIKSQTKETFATYYIKLQLNINPFNMRLKPADYKKLTKFPKYDRRNNELYGSDARMIALWSHVFSLRK